MIASIIKRDGHVIDYDYSKIADAILRACMSSYEYDILDEDELENYRKYQQVMAELDWPAFFEYDPFFHKTILRCVEDNDMEQLLLALHERFNARYLRELEQRLYASPVIADQRMPPIHEAFYLYRHKRYYGAGSILVDQMEGVIKDISEYVSTRTSGYSKQTLALVKSRYDVKLWSEKGQVITALLEARESSQILWEFDYMIGYFRMKFFKDKITPEELEENANRHGVNHGNQCNYGTQDHALRLILCLDALVYVAEILSQAELDEDVG